MNADFRPTDFAEPPARAVVIGLVTGDEDDGDVPPADSDRVEAALEGAPSFGGGDAGIDEGPAAPADEDSC